MGAFKQEHLLREQLRSQLEDQMRRHLFSIPTRRLRRLRPSQLSLPFPGLFRPSRHLRLRQVLTLPLVLLLLPLAALGRLAAELAVLLQG